MLKKVFDGTIATCKFSSVYKLLERTDNGVLIRGTRYGVFTFRGVPGRLVDVIVAEKILGGKYTHSDMGFEINEKSGKFDGAVRLRLAFRPVEMTGKWAVNPSTLLTLDQNKRELILSFKDGHGNTLYPQCKFPLFRSTVSMDNLKAVYMWHYKRYYSFLPEEEVSQEGDLWEMSLKKKEIPTLAELNRDASHWLYRLARNNGWRKLTLRERTHLGIPVEKGMWLHQNELISFYAHRLGYDRQDVVAEATRNASKAGGTWL